MSISENALETALRTQLASGTALIALLGGTAIYNGLPPPNVARPWVTFSLASGLEENQTRVDTQRLVYLIKGVADSLLTAGLLAEQIQALVHHKETSIGSGVFWAARETVVRYQEVDPAGHTIGHAGGEYAFRRG
jgi:hypothetical protein